MRAVSHLSVSSSSSITQYIVHMEIDPIHRYHLWQRSALSHVENITVSLHNNKCHAARAQIIQSGMMLFKA